MTAWKDHERVVARTFGTERRNRGNDFGQSDVEVIASLQEWLGHDFKGSEKIGVIVECKHSKKHVVIDAFKKLSNLLNKKDSTLSKPTIASIGDTLYMWLDDFEEFFIQNIFIPDEEDQGLFDIVYKYNIIRLGEKEPEYINDYIMQAREYTVKYSSKGVYLPIACIAKTRSKKRLVCLNIDDILRFKVGTREWLIPHEK